jgi:hypothetical protein
LALVCLCWLSIATAFSIMVLNKHDIQHYDLNVKLSMTTFCIGIRKYDAQHDLC